MSRVVLRPLFLFIGRLIGWLLFKVTITGRENLPPHGPLILIGNHFSWFEAPIMALYLPYKLTFLAAAELRENWFVRLLFYVFEVIPVRRGQIDRTALRRALQMLQEGYSLAIFPEGGIDPVLQGIVTSGRSVRLAEGQNSRLSAQLIRARPGAAFLATSSQAPVLPMAFLGTELAQQNIRRGRRTPVFVYIGQAFGPLSLDSQLRGVTKRKRLDELGDLMMMHLAALLPPENRGPYN